MTAILPLRPDVEAFAQMMEFNLMAHDQDRGKRGWEGCDPLWLLRRLRDEVDELECALSYSIAPTPEKPARPGSVRREAADVGNFAMMLAVVAGALGNQDGAQ